MAATGPQQALVRFQLKRLDCEPSPYFEFDINRTVQEWIDTVIGLDEKYARHFQTSYSLQFILERSKGFTFYDADDKTLPLKTYFAHFEPMLLEASELLAFQTTSLSPYSYRTGAAHISWSQRKEIQMGMLVVDSRLICPITYNLILLPIKIGEQFYEMRDLTNYLGLRLDRKEHKREWRVFDPLGNPLPEDFYEHLRQYNEKMNKSLSIPMLHRRQFAINYNFFFEYYFEASEREYAALLLAQPGIVTLEETHRQLYGEAEEARQDRKRFRPG